MKNAEKIAKKIAETLDGLCPAFSDSKASTAVWHGCKCSISGSACDCVWHLTSECYDGKWEELAFVDKQKAKDAKKSASMLEAMIKIRTN